jgi:hypothetical protein
MRRWAMDVRLVDERIDRKFGGGGARNWKGNADEFFREGGSVSTRCGMPSVDRPRLPDWHFSGQPPAAASGLQLTVS